MSRELNIFNQTKPVKTNLKDNLWGGVNAYEQLVKSQTTVLPHEKIINNFNETQDKILADITDKTDKLSDKLLNGTEEISPLGKSFIGAGADALGQLPGIINNFSSKAQSSQEATGKVLNMTASGAKIGANFGPWGAAAGAVVGAGAGFIQNEGWRGEMTEEADKQLAITQETNRKELIDSYINQHSSQQIEAQKNLLSSTLGYTTQIG